MSSLGPFLNALERTYHQKEYLQSDPLEFVHRFTDPWDQEAVALVSALLAYGNVKQIRKSIEDVLQRIASSGLSPQQWVRALPSGSQKGPLTEPMVHAQFGGFVHRFNRGADLVNLFRLLAHSWEQYGSLGAHFLTHLKSQDPDISQALAGLIADWRAILKKERKTSRGLHFLLNSPEDGSCCKRWCMFLRWMTRKDGLDIGLWGEGLEPRSTIAPQKSYQAYRLTLRWAISSKAAEEEKTTSSLKKALFPPCKGVRTDQLIIPCDTHVARISQYLGLTQKKTFNWATAVEITQNLKKIDRSDPTRYDFALSRLGILSICQRKYRKEICENCQLLPVCRFAKASSRKRPVSPQPMGAFA